MSVKKPFLSNFMANVLLISYLFIIAYGVIRSGIDKLIKKETNKEEILSKALSTEEGRKKLAELMMSRSKR